MRIYHLLFIIIAFLSCVSNNNKNTNTTNEESKARIEFEEEYHDFGSVKQGEKLTFVYKFKNTGTAELVIKKATPSCGCTVSEFSKEPISPGKKGKIMIVFDTKGRSGVQHKSIRVHSNAENDVKTIDFKANIIVDNNN